MHKPLIPRAFFLLLFIVLPCAHAKNLQGRVGCGVAMLDFNHTPALSVRLHPSTHVSASIVAGFNTESSTNLTAVGVQLRRYTDLEENLNFFIGAQGFLLSDKAGTPNLSTGIELDGILGVEFFFLGISNLGFQFQTGVGVRTLRNFAIKVVGDGFAGFAFHYYL